MLSSVATEELRSCSASAVAQGERTPISSPAETPQQCVRSAWYQGEAVTLCTAQKHVRAHFLPYHQTAKRSSLQFRA